MPLQGVSHGPRKWPAIHFLLKEKILRPFAYQPFGKGCSGGLHQKDYGYMRGYGLHPPEGSGTVVIRQIQVEQEDVYGLGCQDRRGIGASAREGCLQLHPGAPVTGAVQFGQDFAKEQSVFDSGLR